MILVIFMILKQFLNDFQGDSHNFQVILMILKMILMILEWFL